MSLCMQCQQELAPYAGNSCSFIGSVWFIINTFGVSVGRSATYLGYRLPSLNRDLVEDCSRLGCEDGKL